MVNNLAVAIGADLNAGVPFYGAASGGRRRGEVQSVALDQLRRHWTSGSNGMWPEYEAALKGGESLLSNVYVRGHEPRLP
jgi:hypothetical protein